MIWLLIAGAVLLVSGGFAAEHLLTPAGSPPGPAPAPAAGEDELNTQDDSAMTTYLDAWALAIQDHEGWAPGSHSFRNNNPGNLRFANQTGSSGQDAAGFAIFPDYATGLAALKRQLSKYVHDHPSYTVLNIMALYLGNADPLKPEITAQGNPFTYAAAIAAALDVPITTELSQLEAMTGGVDV